MGNEKKIEVDQLYLQKVGVVDSNGNLRSSDSLFEVVQVNGVDLFHFSSQNDIEDSEDDTELDLDWIVQLEPDELLKEYKKLKCLKIKNDFKIPELHKYSHIVDELKAYLVSNGITILSGTFSFHEDKILVENMKNFCEEYKIRSPEAVLGVQVKPFVKPPSLSSLNKVKLGQYLGQNLPNRKISALLHRASLIFNPFRSKKFTAELDKQLCHLVTKSDYPYVNWEHISTLLGRSSKACVRRWSYIRQHQDTGIEWTKGYWSEKESLKLVDIITATTKSDNPIEINTKMIPWVIVAKKMVHRNANQCLRRWIQMNDYYLDRNEQIRLYELVKNYKPNNLFDVDWFELTRNHFPNMAPTSLRLKFIKMMKKCYGSNYTYKMEFKECFESMEHWLKCASDKSDDE